MTIPTISTGTYTPRRPVRPANPLRPPETPEQMKIREAAGGVVAMAFYAPLLKQMRDSPFKDELFSGGKGGDAFNKLLDQQLISRAGRADDPLVDAIVKKLTDNRKKAEEMALRRADDSGSLEAGMAEAKAGMLR